MNPYKQKSELSAFQKIVGEWGNENFNVKRGKYYDKYSHTNSIICHIEKEVKELSSACFKDVPEECADIFLMLLHIGYNLDFDLLEEARNKMEINKKREWGKPDQNGVIEHLK